MNRARTGAWGEQTAADYLQKHGYSIIERNYHARCGEIDIIAVCERCICFVEVRTRAEGSLVSGLESVDLKKMRRVFRTACKWLAENPCDLQPRFDVIEITAVRHSENLAKSINHITNAFGAEVCNEIF